MRPADTVAQRRAAPMVLQQGSAPDAADDANDRRPLQRTALPVHPIDFVLTSYKKVSSGFCDAVAEPSPTGRDAAGLLSRRTTGEVSEAAAAIFRLTTC